MSSTVITIYFAIFFISSSVSIFAQDRAEKFQPGLISNGGVFGFTLSPNGEEAFWVKSNGGRDTLVIMHSVLISGKWQAPVYASFSGREGVWKDIDPVFTPDGKRILFQSNRPSSEREEGRTDFDLWAVERTSTGWGEPYRLRGSVNTKTSESFASATDSGKIYFTKENPDGKSLMDIYVADHSDWKYDSAANVGFPVNTEFRESNPYISPKEDFLIYFSSDSSGFGSVDLVISFREGSEWLPPVNLGEAVNSASGDFCPFFHVGQKRLYFSRTVVHDSGRRTEDIYSVPLNPDKYRKKRPRGKM